jgi:DNA-binding PadR family transcriptional regulator
MELTDLTGFQRDLLFVLAGNDRVKGTEIMNTLRETQSRELLPSRVYTNLDELAESGLINKGQRDGRTNYYELTEAGVDSVRRRLEWQAQFVSSEQFEAVAPLAEAGDVGEVTEC